MTWLMWTVGLPWYIITVSGAAEKEEEEIDPEYSNSRIIIIIFSKLTSFIC